MIWVVVIIKNLSILLYRIKYNSYCVMVKKIQKLFMFFVLVYGLTAGLRSTKIYMNQQNRPDNGLYCVL